jgi:hypothetical protein
MSIERIVRAQQLKPYAQGEEIPIPDYEITEEGLLSTNQKKGNIKVEFSTYQEFPSFLSLRINIIPVPIRNRSTHVQLIVNQTPMEETSYYGTHSVGIGEQGLAELSSYEAIELEFAGQGIWEEQPFQGNQNRGISLLLTDNKIPFSQEFPVQKDSLLVQRQVLTPQGIWITNLNQDPPRKEATPILGYGGFYKRGIKIDKIVPIFSVLGYRESTTYLKLYSLFALQQDNINPPQGGIKGNSHWYFADLLKKDQELSLAGSIEKGFVQITLQNQSTKEVMTYSSRSYRQIPPNNEQLEILFTRSLLSERK